VIDSPRADAPRTPVRRLWAIVGWAMVAAVNVLSLTPTDLPDIGLSHLDKGLHAITYAILMLWFTQLHARRTWVRIALAFIAMGVALELLQGQTSYRSFSYADMGANTAGVLAAWRLALAGSSTVLTRLEQRLETGIARAPEA
jgi:VanZ family protein